MKRDSFRLAVTAITALLIVVRLPALLFGPLNLGRAEKLEKWATNASGMDMGPGFLAAGEHGPLIAAATPNAA